MGIWDAVFQWGISHEKAFVLWGEIQHINVLFDEPGDSCVDVYSYDKCVMFMMM